MSLFEDLAKGGAEGIFSGFAKAVQVFKADPTKVIELEQATATAAMALKQAELAAELKVKEMEVTLLQAQAKINEIEAANPNLFVSGWRPAVGWTCVAGLGYEYLARPLAQSIVNFWHPEYVMVALDLAFMMTLLSGILGLGGLRTFEKVKAGKC